MQAVILSLQRNPRLSWLLAVLLLTAAVYLPIFHNGFVSWDDNIYITDNPLVTGPWSQNLWRIFAGSFEGHYHPLTLISLKFDHSLFGASARAFHLHNLLLHLLNTFLVFQIILQFHNKPMVAGITALLFGIHPMHVEAVAWASARKDVLYTFWFLLAYLGWLRYVASAYRKYLVFSLAAFVLAVLSKGQAVFLPLCLILTDILLLRPLNNRKIWLEKLPYFTIALILGLIAIFAQARTGYTGSLAPKPGIPEMIMLAGYAFTLYLLKLALPIQLSAYYSYPQYQGSEFTAGMWLGLLISVVVLGLVVYSLRKNKVLFFGLMFFIVNIFVFLKWIPVSNYIIADRYTYVSSIGLFFIAGYGLERLRQYSKPFALGSALILVALLWVYALTATARVSIWHDTLSLTNDILKNNPKVYTALNARGIESMNQGDLRAALQDFSAAIDVQPKNARAYANRAGIYAKTDRNPEALKDLDMAVSLAPGNAAYLNNRGLSRLTARLYKEALDDFSAAINASPSFGVAYANRGKVYNSTANFEAALEDLKQAAAMGIVFPYVSFETGIAYYNLRDFNRAVTQFNYTLKKDPSFTEALFYRGFSNYNLGDFQGAEDDLGAALSRDDKNAIAWAMRGMARIRLGKKAQACADFYQAKNLGMKQVEKEIEKNCQ